MSFTIVYEMWRKDGLGREEFARHLREVHAPLVAAMPEVRGYTVLTNDSATAEDAEADGFALLTFDSKADYEAMNAAPAMEASLEDGAKFVGRATVYEVSRADIVA